MENKGQVGVGAMLMLAISIIVGLVILSGSYSFIGQTTAPSVAVNSTVTGVAGVAVDLPGQELLSTPVVVNRTGQQVVGAGNYTITERVSTVTGLKRVVYISTAGTEWAGAAVNVSYTYGQEGYIDDAGGRAVTGLILLLSFMALVVFIVGYIIKEKYF